MKRLILDNPKRAALVSAVAVGGLLAGGCTMPPKEAWHQIRTHGMLPVLLDPNPRDYSQPLVAGHRAGAETSVSPSQEESVRVQPVARPQIVSIPSAEPVPGRPGYVYSPHLAVRRPVDVRDFRVGEEVRCPYTLLSFTVPDFSAIAAASNPRVSRPAGSAAEMVSRDSDITNVVLRDYNRPQPGGSPPRPEVAPVTDEEVPYGQRVPNRPGFVYSPFAARNQLVDVAGIAPGVEVKCPYSNKLFRVPEPLPEEVAPPPTVTPEPAPVLPPAEPLSPPDKPAEPAPPAIPDSPSPAPVSPPDE